MAGSNTTIGLIVGSLGNPFFAELGEGVQEMAWSRGCLSVLADCADDADRQHAVAERMLALGIQGLIITVPHSPEVVAMTQVPVVAVDRCAGIPYVSVDNVQGGRMATAHLIKKGFERVGLLYARSELSPVADRMVGYRMALREYGRTVDDSLVIDAGGLTFEAAAAATPQLLDAGADSVFVINDAMAAGVIAAVQETGGRVPDDLGVVGYDDSPISSWPSVQLTSIAQGTAELGRSAARLILQRIGSPAIAVQPTVLTPNLMQRASSRGPGARAGV